MVSSYIKQVELGWSGRLVRERSERSTNRYGSVILIAPICDRKTTVRRVEFFTSIDGKLLSDFNYIKNFLRRCTNSGGIDENVCLGSSSVGGNFMLRFSSFLDACGGVISAKFLYPDRSFLWLYNKGLAYHHTVLK